jgi:uncharacterized protein YdaU (DUF1376 family)
MSSSRPWYKRYASDFISGTLRLSLEEKGAYSLILDLIYDRGGPIPDDPRYIAGVCGCSVRKWNAIRNRLLEMGKIEISAAGITNSRADKEIENAAKFSDERAESGRKGGEKKAEREREHKQNKELPQAEPPKQPSSYMPEARSQTSQPTEIDNLEAKLRGAAGQEHNPSQKLMDVSPVLRLIDQGVSLDRVIIPKLRSLRGKTFRSWEYPASIIREEMAQQGKTLVPQVEDDERWKTRLGHGRNRKIWATSQWGPPPNHPGCRVPAHLIRPSDGDGWQDWKPEAA